VRNPGIYDVVQNYTVRLIPSSTLAMKRQVVFNPPFRPGRLRFDFAPQNILLNLSFAPPVQPPFQQDLSGRRAPAPINPGLYDVVQNYTLRTPITTTPQPAFTPVLHELVPRRPWTPILYESQIAFAVQKQTSSFPPFASLVAPRVPVIGRQGLLPVLEQNLLNTLLNGVGDSPYVPVDVSDSRGPAPRLQVEHLRNTILFSGTGLRPPGNITPDYVYPPVKRIDYTITVRGFLTSTVSSKPNFPLSQDLPPSGFRRNPDLYTSYSPNIYRILASVKPPVSYSSHDIRPRPIYNLALVLFQPITFALTAPPTFVQGIPNLAYNINNGVQTYDTSFAFAGTVTSYTIAPALDTGFSFNSVTGVLTVNTAVASVATHGPYTIIASNGNGNTSSNAFTILISAGNYKVDGPRVTLSTTALSTTYGTSGPNVTRDKPNSEDIS